MSGFVVTGAASGLGRFLRASFGGTAVARGTPLAGLPRGVILHCAANARRDAPPEALREDNVGFTERLLGVPHERFVFVSSVEAAAPSWDYGRLKAEAEALVLARARRPLVLRCGALLGPGMRPNALVRMLDGAPSGLAADSEFAWVLYEDVRDFVAAALERGLEGIYNVVPSRTATLAEAARALGLAPEWGGFRYRCPAADAGPAREACPGLSRTALENAMIFSRGRSR